MDTMIMNCAVRFVAVRCFCGAKFKSARSVLKGLTEPWRAFHRGVTQVPALSHSASRCHSSLCALHTGNEISSKVQVIKRPNSLTSRQELSSAYPSRLGLTITFSTASSSGARDDESSVAFLENPLVQQDAREAAAYGGVPGDQTPQPSAHSEPHPDSDDIESISQQRPAHETASQHEARATPPAATSATASSTSPPLLPGGAAAFLSLSDSDLLRQCDVDTYRASGPGGQHRNKTESAVRLRHRPSGCVAQSCEQRSQHQNRETALRRLRQAIALRVRSPLDPSSFSPSLATLRILPASAVRQQKRSPPLPRLQHIGPNHPEFHDGTAEVLDLLLACGGSVADVAAALQISTGALSKVLTSDKALLAAANDIRSSQGLKPLR